LELDEPKDYSYAYVADGIRDSLRDAQALVQPAVGDVICAAARGDGPLELPEGLAELRETLGHPILSMFRVHERRPNPRVRPPYAWPIAPELRLAVAESDVFVLHIIDLDAFVGRARGRARLSGYERRAGAYWLIGDVEGERYPLSPALIDEVLLGFETIDSAAGAMLTMIDAVHDAEPPPPEPERPEGLAVVRTRGEAEALAADASAPETYDLVAMPMDLLDEVLRSFGRTRAADLEADEDL
jgi:hypothetical protein